jgi:transketolase
MPLDLGERTYEATLGDLAEADDRVVVMTAENRAMLRNLPTRLGRRFIDTGISEQTLVGAAAGLARFGRVPVVHALAAFLTMRAFEFIRTDVGIPGLPVKLVGFVPGLLSDANGPTHQAIEDIALMRQIPGMRVFSPSDRRELMAALPAIVADPHPWYIRYIDTDPVGEQAPFEPGAARRLRRGLDATILTHGLMCAPALEAAGILAADGFEVGVVDMRTLSPVDRAAVLGGLTAPLCVVVEDHLATGGLLGIVAETALAAAVTGRVVPITLGESWFRPGQLSAVARHHGLDAQGLAVRIRSELMGVRQ